MERGGGRVDRPEVCHTRSGEAVANARRTKLPLVAGGKKLGGRRTSQAQSLEVLAGVRALVFLASRSTPGEPGARGGGSTWRASRCRCSS